MTTLSSRATLFSLSLAAAFAMAGCSTTTPSTSVEPGPGTGSPIASAPATPPPPPDGVPIAAGMKAAQVAEVLGKPVEVRPMDADGVKAEVWIYLRPGQPVTREVTTGMREIQFVDPVSGRELTRMEPIVGYVTETPQLELRLLMFRGSLINWTQVARGADRSFN